jgi:K+-dependent Na+/Ca+ exchanger-like protein
MQIVIYLAILLGSFYLLAVIVDQFFVESLDRIAHRLKLSYEVAGATFMAVGSSAPELFTALIASLKGAGHADIGAGTIVGSAIFNILVIIGVSAAYKKAKLTWQPVIRDLLFYCVSIVALLLAFGDGEITIVEALSFVVMYGVYVFAVTNWSRWLRYTPPDHPTEDVVEELDKKPSFVGALFQKIIPDPKKKYMQVFVVSIILIGALSYALVESAVGLATILNINPAIVALTVLAAGTSVPDLMASVIVAKKGRGDMAIANAVGSNIFDILFALGIPWAVSIAINKHNVAVGTENLLSSVFLLFATVVAVFFVLALKKWEIGKRAGIMLVALYGLYLLYNIAQVL